MGSSNNKLDIADFRLLVHINNHSWDLEVFARPSVEMNVPQLVPMPPGRVASHTSWWLVSEFVGGKFEGKS